MFLSLSGAKAGAIAGEAQDSDHKNEIEVLGWSWGMAAKTDVSSGLKTGRATVRELSIIKRVDKASTPLMSALRSNEIVKGTLTLRKAGKSPLEYLKISFENGLVNSYDVQAGDVTGSAALVERVTFSFQKITIDYTPQGPDGRAQGGMMYSDMWMPASS
jgi:type VI secretion system secreted protein Hcp